MPEATTVLADGVPIFKAKFGNSDGHYALQIIEPIEHKRNTVEKGI
jgi:flagellar motor switch protein FliM